MRCKERVESFDAQRVAAQSKHVSLSPKYFSCSFYSYPLLAYMNRDGTGYLQEAFQVSCGNPKCHDVPMITKAALGSRKLAEDLVSSWQYLA